MLKKQQLKKKPQKKQQFNYKNMLTKLHWQDKK
jgi:hypothetical protein